MAQEVTLSSCEFCEDRDSTDYLYEAISYDNGVELERIYLTYCPKCGRKLEEIKV